MLPTLYCLHIILVPIPNPPPPLWEFHFPPHCPLIHLSNHSIKENIEEPRGHYKLLSHPFLTLNYFPTLLPYLTRAQLPSYKLLMLLIKCPTTPHSCSTVHSSSLQTLSCTFSRSMNATYSSFFFALNFSNSCFNTNLWSIHLLPDLNHPCSSATCSYVLSIALIISTLPYIFQGMLNILIHI